MFSVYRHNAFKNKYLGTFQKEPWMKDSECVFTVKLYSKEVHWIPLWSFGGSALSGWYNKNNTFDPKLWVRVLNTPKAVPKTGDILFYWTLLWPDWHTSAFDSGNIKDYAEIGANATGKKGDVEGDQILIKMRKYRGLLGWFTPKKC